MKKKERAKNMFKFTINYEKNKLKQSKWTKYIRRLFNMMIRNNIKTFQPNIFITINYLKSEWSKLVANNLQLKR